MRSGKSLPSRLLTWVALAALALLFPAGVRAAVIPLTLEEMVAVADEVVVVRGTGTRSELVSTGRIYTTADFLVVENLKGSMTGKSSISYLGGRYKDLVMVAPGIPSLREGEEAVLFLSKPLERLPEKAKAQYNPDSPMVNSFLVVGGHQGKFVISNQTAEGQKIRTGAEPIPAGAPVGRSLSTVPHTKAAGGAVTYGEFAATVRGLVAKSQQKAATKGKGDTITGIYGKFAVPERGDDPVARAFDPLPSMAYMSDAELKSLREKALQGTAAAADKSSQEAAK